MENNTKNKKQPNKHKPEQPKANKITKKPAPIQEVDDLEVAKKMLKIYQSASDRSLEFNLSLDSVRKLLNYPVCYYTGKKFENDGPYSRSFDRVDSAKGYVEGNVVACTIDINGKKSNLSFEEIECIYSKIMTHKSKISSKPSLSEVTSVTIEPIGSDQDGYIDDNGESKTI